MTTEEGEIAAGPVDLKKEKKMKVTEITVSAGRTFNHPYEDYSNLRPNVTLKATLDDGDDPAETTSKLQAMAEKSVEDHKQNLLHSLEELHYLTQAQREMTSLGEQVERARTRLEEIRKQHPQLALSGLSTPDNDSSGSIPF